MHANSMAEVGFPIDSAQVQKKKIWELVQPLLKTDANAVATFKGRPALVAAGAIRAASLANASIS